MGKINDWLLNMMGFNTAPNPYARADWMGDAPQVKARRRLNSTGMSGKTEDQIRELEQRKTLPRRTQFQLLSRNK